MLCVEVTELARGRCFYRIITKEKTLEAGEIHRPVENATKILHVRARIYAGYLGQSSKDSEPK